MDRFSTEASLNEQYNDAYPRQAAQQRYAMQATQINPQNNTDVKAVWLKLGDRPTLTRVRA